jgi:hypothetical protein
MGTAVVTCLWSGPQSSLRFFGRRSLFLRMLHVADSRADRRPACCDNPPYHSHRAGQMCDLLYQHMLGWQVDELRVRLATGM